MFDNKVRASLEWSDGERLSHLLLARPIPAEILGVVIVRGEQIRRADGTSDTANPEDATVVLASTSLFPGFVCSCRTKT